MRRVTASLPHLVAVAVVYLVPATVALVGGEQSAKSLVFGALLGLNPLAALLAAGLHAFRHGWRWWFPVAAAALFLPVALIPPFNDSAFVYAPLYLVAGILGGSAGALLRRRSRRTDDRRA